ncbi:MAG: substrate-binding domain-containing protein [Luteolibacter sp.]
MEIKPLMQQLKFKKIEQEIRQMAKTMPPGAKLPSERSLAESYKCNFLTVRRALKNLVEEKLIERHVGSGTFVAEVPGDGRETGMPQRENRVGVLMYQNGDDYAHKVLQALAHVALVESVELRSAWITSFDESGVEQANQLIAEGCSVLTLPWFPATEAQAVPAFLSSLRLPVSLPMPVQGFENSCFENPQIYGSSAIRLTMALCRYFRLLGRERIALLGPDSPGDTVLQQKLSGYSHFIASEGLESTCGFVGGDSGSMDRLAERWSKYRGDLAVVCYDDAHAFRFMTSMHKLGLSAPDDFAIVGYNDTEISLHCDPALTTVCQDYNYVGHWLLQSARALGRGEVAQSMEPPRLQTVVRGSCGGAGKLTHELRDALPELELIENPREAVTELHALN